MKMARVRAIPKKLQNTYRLTFGQPALVMNWATEGRIKYNWGDKPPKSVHYWIGSHLATACNDPNGIVWGAGFISETVPVSGVPKEIRAVRGWLSNERLKRAGLHAPNIVGDAALLLPKLYQPVCQLERKSLGIIPHCFEWDEDFFVGARSWEDARVIDICGEIESVIEQIVACDRIISSSLHGIICADAYNVPAIWLHASDKPVGDGFKFRDYFSSVGRLDNQPIHVTAKTSRSELEDSFPDYRIEFDADALLSACPLEFVGK